MSELGEETYQGQDHGISGGGENMRNFIQRLSFFDFIDLLPLDSTMTESAMRRRTRHITVLSGMSRYQEEIPRQTRINLILVRIIANANTGT